MANFMGYRNYDAVIECAKLGKLSKETGKTRKLDELSMVVLTYMALKAIDKEDIETQETKHLPYRTYWGGWETMIDDLGMAILTDEQLGSASQGELDVEKVGTGRRNTARNRISRAAKFLESAGLIKRILYPSIRKNMTSVWVLLISPTDDENLKDLNQARAHFNLPPVSSLDEH